jgi:hypothetical protein
MQHNNKTLTITTPEHWASWLRNIHSTRIAEAKQQIMQLLGITSIDTFNNYLYGRTDLRNAEKIVIMDFARKFENNDQLELDFTFTKEKQKSEA